MSTPFPAHPAENPVEVKQIHHFQLHCAESLYYVSVHQKRRLRKPGRFHPPGVYAEIHSYALAGSDQAYPYCVS